MFHLRFGLSDHLKALLDFVFGSRRRVKKVRIFRAWFSHFFQHSYMKIIPLGTTCWYYTCRCPRHYSPFVLQESLLTQPLIPPSRWITGMFETTILSTLTLPKAKVKAKVKARAKKDKVKDQAKEKANLKVKTIVPPPRVSPFGRNLRISSMS